MKGLFFALSLILPACGLPPGEPKCGFLQDESGARQSWNLSLPVSLHVDSQIANDAEVLNALNLSAQQWNLALGKTLIRIEPSPKTYASSFGQNDLNLISFINPWPFKQNQTAITQVRWVGGQLLEADIIFNTEHRVYYYGVESPTVNEFDFLSVAIHELGHALGLDHSKNKDSVMYPYLFAGEVNRTITPQDVVNLKCEY